MFWIGVSLESASVIAGEFPSTYLPLSPLVVLGRRPRFLGGRGFSMAFPWRALRLSRSVLRHRHGLGRLVHHCGHRRGPLLVDLDRSLKSQQPSSRESDQASELESVFPNPFFFCDHETPSAQAQQLLRGARETGGARGRWWGGGPDSLSPIALEPRQKRARAARMASS